VNTLHQLKSETWETVEELPLSKESLIMLLENRIPVITIKQFATIEECAALVTQANLLEFGFYQNVSPKIERIGITVFEYDKVDKGKYFKAVEQANAVQHSLISKSFNPLKRIIAKIQECTGETVRSAFEPLYGNYYVGLMRKIERGTQLHIDYAPAEQPNWEVGNVVAQLSWNLYLKISASDQGKTYIYNRQWYPKDEVYKLDSYGYSNAVVVDVDKTMFQPYVGDVVIFNTRNYHTVEPIDGYRVTFTSAIGLLPSGEIILWS
jgi:hypothetical protein